MRFLVHVTDRCKFLICFSDGDRVAYSQIFVNMLDNRVEARYNMHISYKFTINIAYAQTEVRIC